MNLGAITSYVYRRTKTSATDWGASLSDLVIAANNAYERENSIIRSWLDNYHPTLWTTGDFSTATAVPVFDSLFHELIPLWVCYQYANENNLRSAAGFFGEITMKESELRLFYGLRNYQVFMVTIAAPGVFTKQDHGLFVDDRITLATTGALPTGLAADTYYYVVSVSGNDFNVSATRRGTAITTSGSQSGTQYFSALKLARMSPGSQDNR